MTGSSGDDLTRDDARDGDLEPGEVGDPGTAKPFGDAGIGDVGRGDLGESSSKLFWVVLCLKAAFCSIFKAITITSRSLCISLVRPVLGSGRNILKILFNSRLERPSMPLSTLLEMNDSSSSCSSLNLSRLFQKSPKVS
mmetsp:Transcript_46281/g.104074  ORF Transcript_46281/g.104074 Transcript_46281/m.104074 type:complete len:139 (+) Transcript_46281:686-1102(+)